MANTNKPDKPDKAPTIERGSNHPNYRAARPALTIDYALYEHYLDESGLSAEQKRAFLDALWTTIVSFVDLGFGVHPLQQVEPGACAQDLDLSGLITGDVVSSATSIPANKFETVAAGNDTAAPEREEI